MYNLGRFELGIMGYHGRTQLSRSKKGLECGDMRAIICIASLAFRKRRQLAPMVTDHKDTT